jgi:hypothetical protein
VLARNFQFSKEQRYEWIAGTLKRTGYFLVYLKADISFEMLDQVAMGCTDLEAAEKLRRAQGKLFQIIFKKPAVHEPFVDS